VGLSGTGLKVQKMDLSLCGDERGRPTADLRRVRAHDGPGRQEGGSRSPDLLPNLRVSATVANPLVSWEVSSFGDAISKLTRGLAAVADTLMAQLHSPLFFLDLPAIVIVSTVLLL